MLKQPGRQAQLTARLAVAVDGQGQLVIGRTRWPLLAAGNQGRSNSARDDAAIIAAMHGAQALTVRTARSLDIYALSGAPTAIDAALLACH